VVDEGLPHFLGLAGLSSRNHCSKTVKGTFPPEGEDPSGRGEDLDYFILSSQVKRVLKRSDVQLMGNRRKWRLKFSRETKRFFTDRAIKLL
jgi:hypothetical protein